MKERLRAVAQAARSTMTRRVAIVAGAGLAVLALASGGAAAVGFSHHGSAVTAVAETTGANAIVYTGARWSTVDQTVIFATRGATVDAQFTAESACYNGSGWCSVRILIDGVEAEPIVGTDFAFNEAEGSTSWESHSVDRVRTVGFTGNHSVVVQTYEVGTNVAHRLDDWAIRALAYR